MTSAYGARTETSPLVQNHNTPQSSRAEKEVLIWMHRLTEDAEYEVKLVLHGRSRKKRPPGDHFIKDAAHTPEQKQGATCKKAHLTWIKK